ncbi:sigma 54-interacting transcriptional regulator [Nakamurella aerolata]|uniref:Sigma 54-interacting transcriptional regulator n=1 Tax=Nakamurella aerolata TaxID=1656892 RepID=A0A849A919_9ACTN|nr:sigma 54-interacting transcriptional regulator [Nakamurella aerolata]
MTTPSTQGSAGAEPGHASQPPSLTTVGELREAGYSYRPVKAELRENLLHRLRAGEPSLPGLQGFSDTVVPAVERAILAGHDLVLLGERGQGKTRLMRTLAGLLDEWTPALAGTELAEHPFAPITATAQRILAERGDAAPIRWVHRSRRYTEKLATPDTSVGDLIGDVDPTKLAQGLSLGDPETVHYGLLPRAHRGIFGINELPDLAERIQVGLFNVLEERDIQIRGYNLALPLDLLVVASANPEDYTNRGRIITPLKDRFGAEIRTHYPLDTEAEVAVLQQEAELAADVPDHLLQVIATLVGLLRESSSIDQRSGVSARFGVSAAEELAAAALRRAALTGEDVAVARIGDLAGVLGVLRGKLEFEMGEQDREDEVLAHLLRRATAAVFADQLRGLDLAGFAAVFADGATVETGNLVTAKDLLDQFGTVPGLAGVLQALQIDEDSVTPGQVAAAVEFVLEGMYLTRRLSKDSVDGSTIYGS